MAYPESGFGDERPAEGLAEGPKGMGIMDRVTDAYYGIADRLKELYFNGEDKYYETLDRINPKFPVYKVVDPIDKVVPSFALLLGISSLLIIFLLMGIVGAFVSPAEFDSTFIVSGKGGAPLAGIQLLVGQAGSVETLATDATGKFSISARAGEKVIVETKQDSYKEYSQEFFPVYGRDNLVILKPISAEELALQASPASQKTIEVWDGSGGLLKQVAYATFSCSTGIPSPGKQQSSNGTISVVAPQGCGIMSATVESFGFEPRNEILKGNRTVVKLQRRESAKGIAAITAIDSNSNSPIKGIQISILDIYGNPLDSERSDSAGRTEFDLSPGTYVAGGYDPAGAYMAAVSGSFTVTADERSTATIRMEPTPPDAKVLKIKAVDSVSGEAVRGVAITVSLEGNAVTSAPTQSDGTAIFAGVAEKEHSLVLSKSGYLTKVAGSVSPVSKDSGFTEIRLEKATPQNSGTVKVLVTGYGGGPEKGAKVFLKSPDFSVISASGTTSKEGTVEFKELPLGMYYAQASKDDANGTSDTNELFAGQDLILEVPLVLGKGTIKVEVDDEYGNDIETADIVFVDSISGERLLATTTSEYGKAEADFTWVRKPYLIVTKPGFFKVTTSPIEIVPGTKETVKVKLYSEIDYPDFGIYLKGVYRSNKSTLASRLYPENAYYFKMAVVAPDEGYGNVTAEIITDSPDRPTAESSYLVVKNPYADNASLAVSAFSGMEAVDVTQEDAKRIAVNIGAMNTGVREFYIKTYLKEIPESRCVEVPFLYSVSAEKDGVSVKYPAAGRKIEGPYSFGEDCGSGDEPLCDSGDDGCMLLDIGVGICDTMESECSRSSHFEAIPFDRVKGNEFRFEKYEIVTGNPYMLEFRITNSMNNELDTTMYMEVDREYENSITWSPEEEDIEIDAGDDDKIEFSLLAKKAESSLYLYALFEDNDYPAARLEFGIEQGEPMSMYIDDKNPGFLTAGMETAGLRITVKEAGSMEGVEDAAVTVCESEGGCLWGDLCDAKGLGDGVYECQGAIPAYEDGAELYIFAEKEPYEPAQSKITVVGMPEMPTEKLKCIHISPAYIPADIAEKKFTIYAYDPANPAKKCPEDVYITLERDSADSTLSVSPLSFGTEHKLSPGGSVAVTASLAGGLPGAYSALVYGRPVSETEKTKLKEVDIEFGSSGGSFRLVGDDGKEKYVFNISHKVDGAAIVNDSFGSLDSAAIGLWQETNKQYLNPVTRAVSFSSPDELKGADSPVALSYTPIPSEDLAAKIDFEYVLSPGAGGGCAGRDLELTSANSELTFEAPCDGRIIIGKAGTSYSGSFVVLLNSGSTYSLDVFTYDTSVPGWVGTDQDAFIRNYEVIADNRWGGDYILEPFGLRMASEDFSAAYEACAGSYGGDECEIDCATYYECYYGDYTPELLEDKCLLSCPGGEGAVETMCNARQYGYFGADYSKWKSGTASSTFKIWDGGRHYCEKLTGETGTFSGLGRSIKITQGQKIYAKGKNAALTLQFIPDGPEEEVGQTYTGKGSFCTAETDSSATISLSLVAPGEPLEGYGAQVTAAGASEGIDLDWAFVEGFEAPVGDFIFSPVLVVWRKDAFGQPMSQCTGTTPAVPYETDIPIEIRNYGMEGVDSMWAYVDVKDYIAAGEGFSEGSGQFRVKLVLSEDALAFGEDALPPVLLDWSWAKFIGSTVFDSDYRGPCDHRYANASFPDAPYYCDSTQFAMELMYKLSKIYELGQAGKKDSDFGNLKEFDVYLLGDGFSSDFRGDFDRWAGAMSGFWTDYKSKWYKYLLRPENLGLPSSWGPGLYHVEIKGTEEEGYDFFGSNGEPLREIKVGLEAIGGQYKNPLYYLSFNGQVGFDSALGKYHRMGYGLGYTGTGVLQITPPTITGQSATAKTAASVTGSGLAELEVIEKSPFDAGPALRPGVLSFETVSSSGKPKYRATYMPSIPVPVGVGFVQGAKEAEVHFFYSLMTAKEETVDLGTAGALWTGMGSSLGDCTDFYGSPLPYKEPDMPIKGAGSVLCPEDTEAKAYGFAYTGLPLDSANEFFLQSIFYLPDQTYLMKNVCSSQSIKGITMGLPLFQFPETYSTTVAYPSLGISPRLSVAEIFNMVRNPPQAGEELQPWMGAVDSGDSIRLMWNEELLYSKLMSRCTDSCGQACELISTVQQSQDPLSPLGISIALEHTGTQTSSPFCPDDDGMIKLTVNASGCSGSYRTNFQVREGGEWLTLVNEDQVKGIVAYKYKWEDAIYYLSREPYKTATIRAVVQDKANTECVSYKDISFGLKPEYYPRVYPRYNVCKRPE